MIRGMDVSSYLEMKDKGYRYFDETGEEVDVLEYAVKRGFNYARLRLWNEPQNEPESGGYCDPNIQYRHIPLRRMNRNQVDTVIWHRRSLSQRR